MNFALVYAAHRFVFRVVSFFHHWYVDGSRFFIHRFVSALAHFDETFAVRLTLAHFFEPLYKDYSIPGRAFGIVFRTGRVIIGALLYIAISAFFFVLYVAWLSVPLAILFFVADGLPQ